MSLRTALKDVLAGKAFLIYWKEEDSVSLARLEDMVEQDGEPNVGDMVKVKFQCLVYQGQVAEVGTIQTIQRKVESFLDGTYTPFSRKRAGSPPPEADVVTAKRVNVDKENVTSHRLGQGRAQRGTGRGRGANS